MPLRLTLPAWLDLSRAKISFFYDACPLGDEADGLLRIWRTNSSVRGADDFINADTRYLARELGMAKGSREVTLWVEGVKWSESLGDGRIEVVVDPTGDTPDGAQGGDAVTGTVIAVDLDGDSDDDGEITNADDRQEETLPTILNINGQSLSESLYIRRLPAGMITSAKLNKTGNGKFWLYSDAITGNNAMGTEDTEALLDVQRLYAEDQLVLAYGMEAGTAYLSLEVILLNGELWVDNIAISVVRADMIFRNGNEVLAWLSDSEVTHGGIDTSDDKIYDVGPDGWNNRSEETFYRDAKPTSNPTRKRFQFSGSYMADRIRAKLFDNLRAKRVDLPTKFNLFSSADNYNTANCLEVAHKQWQRAIREVRAELMDPVQVKLFEQAYYDGKAVKNLVTPLDRSESVEVAGVLMVAAQAKAEGLTGYTANLYDWNVEFYDTYSLTTWTTESGPNGERVSIPVITVFYRMRVVAPNSYLSSSFFREVPY